MKKRSASKKRGREDESAIEEEAGDRKIERRDDWKANVEVKVMDISDLGISIYYTEVKRFG
jgi:hypothetical protein